MMQMVPGFRTLGLKVFRGALLTILLSALPEGPANGQWSGAAIQSPSGSAGLALVETPTGYSLEDVAGTRRRLTVAEGTRLSALSELSDGWIAAGELSLGEASDLVLIRQRGLIQEALPQVPGTSSGESAAFRHDPEPLIQAGELVGLAWLEGDDHDANSVRAARWSGQHWEAIETVSPAIHEAQLALGAAVLDDGSWILVWAAFQDGDDDIFWSRYAGGIWSEPQSLHADNDVPDILPDVVAVPGGALVAWSWYDGRSNRLRIARFDGMMWSDTGYRGETGSRSSSFFATELGARFLYRSAEPPIWTVLELSADGSVERRAVAPREGRTPPILRSSGPDELMMWWPARVMDGLRVRAEPIERRVEWDSER